MSAGLDNERLTEQAPDPELDQTVASSPEDADPTAGEEPTESPEVADPESPSDPPSDPQEPETPTTDAEPEWITEDHRALAASYGLDAAELASFDSAGDFQRACRMMDRHLVAGGQPQGHPPAQQQQQAPPADARSQTPLVADQAAPPTTDDLTLDLSQYEGYDDETLRIVKVAKHQQEKIKQFEEQGRQFQEALDRIQQERAEEANYNELLRFHDAVDEMDKDLFGGDAKLTPETDGRRQSLWEAYHQIKAAAIRTAKPDGRPVKLPPMKVLLQRAALFAFGNEILASQKQANARAIADQAKRRRPAPGKGKVLQPVAPTQAEPGNIRDAAKEIANSPAVAALFDRYAEENGNAPQ